MIVDAGAAGPSTATSIAAIIGAVGSVIAAAIAAWAVLRAQSYKQLLRDMHDIVEELLDKTLGAEDRGQVIARWVMQAIRDAMGRGSGEQGQRRRWYDRD